MDASIKPMSRAVLMIALFALVCGAAPKPTPPTSLASYFQKLVHEGTFSGTVLVAEHGHVIFEHSYGSASVEFRVPNSAETRFRIFSITKQMTATAILQLAARGRLQLDEPVTQILPELPDTWSAVTVRDLLLHTSGIPQDENIWANAFMYSNAKTQLDNLQAIKVKIAKQPLDTKPGTNFAYNNFGYDLLGCVIERVSRQSLDLYFETHIFRPANMRSALLQGRADVSHTEYIGNAPIERLATGYNGAPGALEIAWPQMYASAGAGGIVATVGDFLHYDDALTAGTILSRAWQQRAISDAFSFNARTAYGYGWVVVHTVGHGYYVYHDGGSNGYASLYIRVPDRQLCVVVLSNYGFTPVDAKMRGFLVETMLGASYAPVKL
jgi:D-alanyl-D-alanine carboxypeptidase